MTRIATMYVWWWWRRWQLTWWCTMVITHNMPVAARRIFLQPNRSERIFNREDAGVTENERHELVAKKEKDVWGAVWHFLSVFLSDGNTIQQTIDWWNNRLIDGQRPHRFFDRSDWWFTAAGILKSKLCNPTALEPFEHQTSASCSARCPHFYWMNDEKHVTLRWRQDSGKHYDFQPERGKMRRCWSNRTWKWSFVGICRWHQWIDWSRAFAPSLECGISD